MANSKDSKSKVLINMPEAIINDKVLKELQKLFEISPPYYLRKSVTDIFFSYLCNTDQEDYKPEIKEIATDFYFLIRFLEKAEKENREKPT